MPSKAAPVNVAVARIAAIKRHNGEDDPRLPLAERDLRAAKLRERVRADVATWPPLSASQKAEIAALLTGGES